ncbi:MAG TPA: beta-ketoacyl synthase N-terminal-like domain-containing protein [Alcaligenes sp.]|nr:beta-ketoacyl synthase N-terminal-like domain-containing protein [Alcaligenes sp.]HRL27963.1 beta-ketoacyl synthase N-terminal-like domain-containing protein [Alcaligenes sp.]
MQSADDGAPLADVLASVSQAGASSEPAQIQALAARFGFGVQFGGTGLNAHFDFLLHRLSDLRGQDVGTPVFASAQHEPTSRFNQPDFAKRRDGIAARLKAMLKESLPEYLCPGAIEVLRQLPKTPNGKINRAALPAPTRQARSVPAQAETQASLGQLERQVAQIWRQVLGLSDLGVDENFFDLGGHSFLAARARVLSEKEFGSAARDLSLFEYPSVRSWAAELGLRMAADTVHQSQSVPAVVPASTASASAPQIQTGPTQDDIAIIGLACRVPGANEAEAFWHLLAQGREGIRPYSQDELDAAGVPKELRSREGFVPFAALLEGADLFDADFFSYSAREAAMTDPQHRVLLECAWHALENAGYADNTRSRPVGVFVGAGMNHYVTRNVAPSVDLSQPVTAYQTMIGNDKDYLATRVSYKLNLTGPGLTVQTACSTSLVAVHQACQSLRLAECDLALAGGVAVQLPLQPGYMYQEGMILSPDGRCRAFDASAQGTVAGSGVGVVVLKRLSQAIRDGDPIRAVIRGSAINNDGFGKIGYTAPSAAGQADVIARALAQARLSANDISYVETHGTGTPLGDPIEIAGLSKAFSAAAQEPLDVGVCAIGSVKTNVGHLDAAAGVIGLIKTVLALEHREIPASLHFTAANPQTALDSSPFFVNARSRSWVSAGVRRAGVSSFGIGGTNAHVVLEQAPEQSDVALPACLPRLLCLSARSANALMTLAGAYAKRVAGLDQAGMAALCLTTQTGARHWPHRLAVWARDEEQCARVLRDFAQTAEVKEVECAAHSVVGEFSPAVGFVFGMDLNDELLAFALGLHDLAVFRALIEPAECLLIEHGQESLWLALQGWAAGGVHRLTRQHQLVLQVGIAQLWQGWGLTPARIAGTGWGEYAAACFAGCLSLESGLRLIDWRSGNRKPGAEPAFPQIAAGQATLAVSVSLAGAAAGSPIQTSYWQRFDPNARHAVADRSDSDGSLDIRLGVTPGRMDASPLDSRSERKFLSPWADVYLAGASLDWARVYQGLAIRRAALPAYPFQRQRYWLQPSPNPAPEQKTQSQPRVVTYTQALVSDAYRDHVVHGSAIVPGTALLRWMVEAACQALGTERIVVRDVFWHTALTLDERRQQNVRIELCEQRSGSWDISLKAADADAQAVSQGGYASASVCLDDDERMGEVPGRLAQLQAQFDMDPAHVSALYARCQTLGIEYGPRFQVVRALGSRPGQALGRVELDTGQSKALAVGDRWAIVLDGCLQLIGACLPQDLMANVVPVALDAFTVLAPIPDKVWSHVSVQALNGPGGADYEATVSVFDSQGAVLAVFQGLRLKVGAVVDTSHKVWRDWLHEVQWQAQGAVPASSQTALPQRWLVAGHGAGLGAEVVSRLTADGQQARLLDTALLEQGETLAASLGHILDTLGGVDCVLDLQALSVQDDGASVQQRQDELAAAMEGSLTLIQALMHAEPAVSPRVLLVTRQAIAVQEGETLDGVWQAPFLGMAKVLGREHPELACRSVDLGPQDSQSDIAALLQESRYMDGQMSVAYRGQARWTATICRSESRHVAGVRTLKGDRCYLIAGGTGAMGMKVAQWMVDRGARHIVLLSRQGRVGASDAPVLEQLAARGVQLDVQAVDMSSAVALEATLARIRARGLPLGGIVHAAGVLDDGVLLQQTWPRVRAALAPKLPGAWHLHHLTLNEPLEFFVLFSSIASLYGFMGQLSHTAASAFLDALAGHRAALGLPALSINWGPWAGIGVAAERSQLRGNRVEWIQAMSWEQSMQAFDWLMRGAAVQAGVFSIDPAFRQPILPMVRPATHQPTAFISDRLTAPDRHQDPLPVAQTQQAVPSTLAQVCEVVAAIIGIDPAQVDAARGLFDSGLDSLAAIELRQKLQTQFGVSLPATLVFKFPTVAAIAKHLDAQGVAREGVTGATAAAAEVATPAATFTAAAMTTVTATATAVTTTATVQEELANLSEDTLALLLKSELDGLSTRG